MKIFSYKIKFLDGNKGVGSGRLKANSMQEATQQLRETITNGRNANVSMSQLKNQELAMRQWDEYEKQNSAAAQ